MKKEFIAVAKGISLEGVLGPICGNERSRAKSMEEQIARRIFASPWLLSERVVIQLWQLTWFIACRWTPKPLNCWRLLVLKVFGANISGKPFVHSRARVHVPWKLTLEDQACLGDGANVYTLDKITVRTQATIAQEAYICTGSHDFAKENIPVITAPIIVEQRAFIGLRAIILPGVTIGKNAIVGAGSVVTRDVAENTVVTGSPARVIRKQESHSSGKWFSG